MVGGGWCVVGGWWLAVLIVACSWSRLTLVCLQPLDQCPNNTITHTQE